MPPPKITIGPFVAIWVGKADDSAVLSRVNLQTTAGGTVRKVTPGTYVDCLDNEIQSGRVLIEVGIKFGETDHRAVKLAMGSYLDAAQQDDPSGFAVYSVVLLHHDVNVQESIYLPRVMTKKDWLLNKSKRDLSITPVNFYATHRNRFIEPYRLYKRTRAEIHTLLGSRSPFS